MGEIQKYQVKKYLLLRTGPRFDLDEQETTQLEVFLSDPKSQFINFRDNTFAVNDISGIYDESNMKETTYYRRGWYQCEYGTWHSKQDECRCWSNRRQ